MSQPSQRAQGTQAGSWHRDQGTQGLRPSSHLGSKPPKCSGWLLPLDAPRGPHQPRSHMLKGNGTSCSTPGTQRALHGHAGAAVLVLSLAHPRSLTPQGCVSPESADLSLAPEERGQLKRKLKETPWQEQCCFSAAVQRTCPSAPGTKTWEVPLSSHPRVPVPQLLTPRWQ